MLNNNEVSEINLTVFPQVKSVRAVCVSHKYQISHKRVNYPFPQVKAVQNYVLIAMFPQIMSLNNTNFT